MRATGIIFLALFTPTVIGRSSNASHIKPVNLSPESHPKQPLNRPHIAGDDEPSIEEIWAKAVCKGQKLYQAMISDADHAAPFINPVHSPWAGKMTQEFQDWSYQEMRGGFDAQCDFDVNHGVAEAFAALGIDARSTRRNGPNRCYHVEHRDKDDWASIPLKEQMYIGPDGKMYRVTGAHFTIGVNPASGILYFLSRDAPASAAEELWGYKPPPSELPLLRASSDIAWAFWNRANGVLGVANIRMIMCVGIINEDTEKIMQRAMENVPLPPGQPRSSEPGKWPGTEIAVNPDDELGMALLGSPNAIAAAFFLAQHKNVLGATKTITKITLFTSEFESPMMMLWVGDRPASHAAEKSRAVQRRSAGGGRVVEKGMEKSVLREHVVRVEF